MNFEDAKRKFLGWFDAHPMVTYYMRWTLTFGVILFAGFFLMSHILGQRSRVQSQISTIHEKMRAMAQLNLTAENRDQVLRQIQTSAEMEAKQFVRMIDVPALISGISASATTNDIQLRKVNSMPNEPVANFPYARVPIQIELEGEYRKIGDFIAALKQRVPELHSWEKIRMTGVPKPQGNVQMEVKLTFYSSTK